ncbi:hypothetical protein [Cupriavidus sp. CP313]
MKSAAAMRARDVVTDLFGSRDAFANLEHALFGLFCALTGFLFVQLVLYAVTPLQPNPRAAERRKWARGVVMAMTRKAPRFAQALSRGVVQAVQWVVSDGYRLRVICLAGIALISGWFSIDWRYSHLDFFVAVAWLGFVAWLLWDHQRAVQLAKERPLRVILLVAALIWVHWEVVWKVEQLITGRNSLDHALRHLAFSGGTGLVAGLLLSRLFYWKPGRTAALCSVGAGFAFALTVAVFGSPTRAPAFGTKGFAISGAADLRPIGVAMEAGRVRLLYRQGVDVEPYILADDGHMSRVDFATKEHYGVSEMALQVGCGTVMLKKDDRQAIVQPVERCRNSG